MEGIKPIRCEGWRRYGSMWSLGGTHQWVQCKSRAIAMLTVVQQGKTQTYQACAECWDECVERKVKILGTKPIRTPKKPHAARRQ